METTIPSTATGTWYYTDQFAPLTSRQPRPILDFEAERGWDEVIDDLLRYRSYEDDFDGEGSVAPTKELVDGAITLAQSLRESGEAPADMVVPGVNGTIYFEWHSLSEFREIEVQSADVAVKSIIVKGSSKGQSTRFFLHR